MPQSSEQGADLDNEQTIKVETFGNVEKEEDCKYRKVLLERKYREG